MSRTLMVLAFVGLAAAAGRAAGPDYDLAALEKFRENRENALKGDNGWLTVAGLHFLTEGENRFGSGPLNDLVIDAGGVPESAGVFVLDGTRVRVRALPGRTLRVNDAEVAEADLKQAGGGKPADLVRFGDVTLFVHHSGPRLAIRVRDLASPLRTRFTGLRWFAPNPAYRVVATFTPYAEPKTVQVPNILGDLETYTAPGTVTFSLNGQRHTMEGWTSGERLWFVFRDLTAGKESYPSARFLTSQTKPENGEVVIDFNYAYNPPCAYNPWTTCPLPPSQNRLPVRVEAGEQIYESAATASAVR